MYVKDPHPYKAKLLILHFLKVLPELSQINSLSALVMVFQVGKREIRCVWQHIILLSLGKNWFCERADSTGSVNIYIKEMNWSFYWPLKNEAGFLWAGHFKGFKKNPIW